MPDIEEWRPVAEMDGWYDVSSHGNVRSWHNNRWGRAKTPRPVSIATHDDGRQAVFLCKKGERGVNYKVHVLVMSAFVGPRPDGMEICHADGNPRNNHLTNLRYDTHISNCIDTLNHGRTVRGDRNGMVVLTAEDVLEVVEMWNTGQFRQWELAERYGVHRTAISGVVNGYTWSWLTGIPPKGHAATVFDQDAQVLT